jgi:hypothetical protein
VGEGVGARAGQHRRVVEDADAGGAGGLDQQVDRALAHVADAHRRHDEHGAAQLGRGARRVQLHGFFFCRMVDDREGWALFLWGTAGKRLFALLGCLFKQVIAVCPTIDHAIEVPGTCCLCCQTRVSVFAL